MAAAAVAGNMSLARWCIWGWGRGGAGDQHLRVMKSVSGLVPRCGRTMHGRKRRAGSSTCLLCAPVCCRECCSLSHGLSASSASPVKPAGCKSAMHAKRRCQLCQVAWIWYIVWQVPDRHVDTGVFAMLAGRRSTAAAFRRQTNQPTNHPGNDLRQAHPSQSQFH